MSLPRLAVFRPITTTMLLLSVLVFGGIAIQRLPLAFLPEIDVPFIGIEVPYPNSNPAQIEKEITKPVEEILATLSGVKRLTSESRADGASVFLQFDWGENLDIVRMQVSEKIDQVKPELPRGVGNVLIYSFNTSDIPVVEARISAQGVDLSENYELLESRVLNRIRRVPGVAKVDLDGVAPKEIFIELALDKVKEHGVDVSDLVGKLRSASTPLVIGEVQDGGTRYTARAKGAFASLDDLRNAVIDERGLRLRDVAEVLYEEPAIAYARRLNQQDAIALTVYKESTANTVDVVRAVMGVIETDIDNDPLLKGVDLFVWDDQAEEILGALGGLTKAGLIGALLAIAVLYVFLRRLRSTLIVSLSIPFSIIAACGVMFFLGKTLNVLSMMGLMLGVGMLVDNAIVVLESIDRRRREESDRRQATLTGSQHVGLAVTASTATSLIVFLPLIVGPRSQITTWLGEVGLTICLALICSLFSSLTLIPLMSSRFLKDPGRPLRFLTRLEARYVAVLGWTLRHRVKTFFILVFALVVGILPFVTGILDTSPFSATVNERMYLRYDFTDFVYKSRVREVVEEVEEYLAANKEALMIESIYSFFRSNEAGTTLTLSRKDLGDKEIKALRKKIRDGLPEIAGVKLLFDEDTDQGGGSTYFDVNFYGQDSAVLASLAAEAERRLETIPGIVDLSMSLGRGRNEVQVKIDRDKAARLGMTAEEVSQMFGFTLGGLRLPRFNAGDREVETWLYLRLEDRENLADLKKMEFRNVDGRPVTLGDFATFEIIEKPEEIERRDRKVRVAVKATYEGEKWDEVREEIEGLMNAFSLPGGYSWSWNDRILQQDSQDKLMFVNLLLALILVYLVMASLFESLAQPFAILFSIPFAVFGAAWLLVLTGTPFNFMAKIGLLILMGIVVNNGIVLLDHLNQLRRAGLSTEEAILAAGRDRMRAILMTASTTIIGLLPLAVGGSRVGGLFYYPLALTVIGGLLSSSVLTLLILPYVNLGVEGFAAWLRRIWTGSSPVVEVPGERVEAIVR